MKKLIISLLFFGLGILSCNYSEKDKAAGTIDLAGKWMFKKDPANKGLVEKWQRLDAEDEVNLPGSMTSNGKGDEISLKTRWVGSIFDSSFFFKPDYARYRVKGHIKIPFGLQPDKHYTGVAWYQREIDIPEGWKGKRLQLVLERPHWQTKVWLDDDFAGAQNSLSTPHVFVMANPVYPGKHRLTIRVDNGIGEINPGQNSHSITDHTQTNWNGIVGRIFLRPIADVSIAEVQVYPDYSSRKVRVVITLDNKNAVKRKVNLSLQAGLPGSDKQAFRIVARQQEIKGETPVLESVYDMGNAVKPWDEFGPNLYAIKVSVSSEETETDFKVVNFGFRDIKTQGRTLLINNRPVFLRGTVDCAIFPLTGFPPTDKASWAKVFKTARSYGLNHMRFHSWCPPEAAFEAADAAGFYLQIECASWVNWGSSLGDGNAIDRYVYEESRKIISAYGNHPSFVMMTYGNEPKRTEYMIPYLSRLVKYWKGYDRRRIYTSGAGRPVLMENDYHNIPDPRIQHAPIGLKSIINGSPPSTSYDWTEIINAHEIPVVSHEMGQWCAYPDLKEIKKYTGILKARNFEIFADRLKDNGLISLADSFLLASGKLQVLCYKSDIEAALRTPGMAGFQLLGLQDFPGQGTAIVGLVNPFWEDKGYVRGKEFRKFCSSVVPLARFKTLNLLNNQPLAIPVQVSNFGKNNLKDVIARWKVTNTQKKVLFDGKFPAQNIAVGKLSDIGLINQSLQSISMAQKLTLSVEVAGNENTWDFFVYPANLPKVSAPVLVTRTLNARANEVLKAGGNVLLTFTKGSIAASKGGSIAIGFSSIFWNTAWSKGAPPHTLGILCDPKHPALADFPADFHSNWQWWDAMSHSDAIILDSVSGNIKPIVRVIDDWVTARSLGLLFEGKVGKGKVIVSGIDLTTDMHKRPEARQLLYSLKKYMGSPNFNPHQSVNASRLHMLL